MKMLFMSLKNCLVIMTLIGVCSDALSLKKRLKKLELEMEALEEIIENLGHNISDNADGVQNVNESIKQNDLDLTVLRYAVGGTIQDVETLDHEISINMINEFYSFSCILIKICLQSPRNWFNI